MPRRYSDISRGPLLAQANQRRQQYLARDISERNATSNLGQRTSSPAVYVLVRPFNTDFDATDTPYRVRTNQRNRQQLGDDVGTHATVPTDAATGEANGNFTPAKIKLFVQTSRQPATSRITGIRYLRSVGQNYSHPFGKTAATDRMMNVFETIATGLRNASGNNKITLAPEKFSFER